MKCGFWNVRGWNNNPDSDNYNLRLSCILNKQIDILAVAETHLCKDDVLNINGYSWFGLNRKLIHINARKGSGGVGFLIKNDLLEIYDINILNKEHEGIL